MAEIMFSLHSVCLSVCLYVCAQRGDVTMTMTSLHCHYVTH